MLVSVLGRVTRRGARRGPCRDGHVWSDRCDPVACSRCGRVREGEPA